MSIRVAIRHKTTYEYDRAVTLSPHLVRLRPAAHCRTPVHSYSLKVSPENHFVNWQQDPFGNFAARYVFPEKTRALTIDVELIAEMTVINPFDFFVEDYASQWPFEYDEILAQELAPYLKTKESSKQVKDYVAEISREPQDIVAFLVKLNQDLQQTIGYNVRMEPGVQTCAETLKKGTGSCRDTGWLLVQIARHLGLASRFVSGYLVQLTADVASLDGPSGTLTDFTDLHAWAEIYVPGAGWIGLDPTSGMFAGEGHIPLSCTPDPASAAPVTGLVEPCETKFHYENSVTRIHEDARVTRPYTESQWQAVMALGSQIDAELTEQDVRLTQGGEPTFVSIEDLNGAEWNTVALGAHKEGLARTLLQRLSNRFATGALLHHGQGKWYPGETLPRWAYSCFFRTDGETLWQDTSLLSPADSGNASVEDAQRFTQTLMKRLRLKPEYKLPAYEDAAHYLQQEAALPVDIDPYSAGLKESQERRRLADILCRGADEITGYVVPLAWSTKNNQWHSAVWPLRRERLELLAGDSAMGYRLPLASLPWESRKKQIKPQRDNFEESDELISASEIARRYSQFEEVSEVAGIQDQTTADDEDNIEEIPHTAICVQPREGRLWVFLPPVTQLEHWIDLIAALESTAKECQLPIDIEGYEPPSDPRLHKLAVTPDPGVIVVNVQPSSNWQDLISTTEILYKEARLNRLCTERFMLDGRHTGTGGGNHVTLGATTPADSPFLRRPDLLASLVLFWQHHPSLSYLFSGLFIGPTSQAPRIDEARDDILYELEIAMQQLAQGEVAEPWQVDRLFRNILVDITGNTHRSEFGIDKLYSPSGPSGQLGLLKFRAFEMPPHWQMSGVQMLLLRALVVSFWKKPYRVRPACWGTALHDRFMLPHYIKQDLHQVLEHLEQAGVKFDASWFEPFIEFRFPHYGQLLRQGIELELHAAIEPWHILREELASTGAAIFVDSSVERLQLTVKNFNNERYCISCNGRRLPLQRTEVEGRYVAGVRFKAWQPAFGLHTSLPADAPLVFDIVDLANQKSIGGCTYHVADPGGRNYESIPVNANEAQARRIARFQDHGHTAGKMNPPEERTNANYPCTLDLRYKP